MAFSSEVRYGGLVLLLALIGTGLYLSFDDAPAAVPSMAEFAQNLAFYAEGEAEDMYKFRDEFQFLATNASNISSDYAATDPVLYGTINFQVTGFVFISFDIQYCTGAASCIIQIQLNVVRTFAAASGIANAIFRLGSGGVFQLLGGKALFDVNFEVEAGTVECAITSAITPIIAFSGVGKSHKCALAAVFTADCDVVQQQFNAVSLITKCKMRGKFRTSLIAILTSASRALTSSAGKQFSQLCGSTTGDLTLASGVLAETDVTSCDAGTWDGTTPATTWETSVATNAAYAANTIDCQTGAIWQFKTITSTSLAAWVTSSVTAFTCSLEAQGDSTNDYTRPFLYLAGSTCPTGAACTAVDCGLKSCQCSASVATVNSKSWCVVSLTQKEGDDSNQGLWALFALFALPVVCIAGFIIMKICKPKATPPVPIKEEPVYPMYPAVDSYTVYPTASVEYPAAMPAAYPSFPEPVTSYPTMAPVSTPLGYGY